MNYPEVIYDDEWLLVINKPPGWVVHAGVGETGETIVDWLIKNYPIIMDHAWEELGRVGIVHRLDKDTSGIMVLAKSPEILTALQNQFKERSTKKEYVAIIYGCPKETEGHIETYVGRHPKRRQEQAVLPIQQGEAKRRLAITDYIVTHSYTYKKEVISKIDFFPSTGRMHQLRLHAKYLGTPILGDAVYTIKPAKRLSKELGVPRQMLHAASLAFRHPNSEKRLTYTAPLPEDMRELESRLQR